MVRVTLRAKGGQGQGYMGCYGGQGYTDYLWTRSREAGLEVRITQGGVLEGQEELIL